VGTNTVRSACAQLLTALALQVILQPAFSETNSEEIVLARAAAVLAATEGCMAAVIDPAVTGYMQRAAEVGKPFATEAAARADMTGNPQWRTIMEPAIRKACECSMKREIEDIGKSQTVADIQQVLDNSAERLKDPTVAEVRMRDFERCLQPLLERLDEKK
jgi:hypothetical protein